MNTVARTIRRLTYWLPLAFCVGCRMSQHTIEWHPPIFTEPRDSAHVARCVSKVLHRERRPCLDGAEGEHDVLFGNCPLHLIEAAERAYQAASQQELDSAPACVDNYFQTVLLSWQYLDACWSGDGVDPMRERVWSLYHSALGKLIATSQQFGCYDPQRGLTVCTSDGVITIPIDYRGFVWCAEDFNQLTLVGDYSTPDIRKRFVQPGLGVPLVVTRRRACREPLHFPQQHFPATVVFRVAPTCTVAPAVTSEGEAPAAIQAGATTMKLEMYDPWRVSQARTSAGMVVLNRDLSASFAMSVKARGRDPLREFMQVDNSASQSKLMMLEPYQPGKIPLVFVQGLLSDPLTWIDLANEMQSRPDILDRYQLWAFQYPTGQQFLLSAHDLRSQSRRAAESLDPQGADPAMREMVLIGHSMGGLVSKLQITTSGDCLWKTVASKPLDSIVADPQERDHLRKIFFFEPQPFVRRVVFVGTPHRGSPWADRPVGRLGSRLVTPDPDEVATHRRLLEQNPGTFAPIVQDRIPTSIDMLETEHPTLRMIYRLPVSCKVQLHSIIGTGRPMRGEPADGIVTVASARHGGVRSETLVDEEHVHIHRNDSSIEEIVRILHEHVREFDGNRSQTPSPASPTPAAPLESPSTAASS